MCTCGFYENLTIYRDELCSVVVEVPPVRQYRFEVIVSEVFPSAGQLWRTRRQPRAPSMGEHIYEELIIVSKMSKLRAWLTKLLCGRKGRQMKG